MRATDKFPDGQLYAVLILTNAGVDLEHCTLQSLVQAKSILFQVCLSLAAIEKKYRFEHRDLHWGNILTAPTTQTTVRVACERTGGPRQPDTGRSGDGGAPCQRDGVCRASVYVRG